ncbi:MAG: HlyD family efflux transporter periplasmic adaptor subunit [Thiomonas sp.]|uniref:HlyD family secretion protein n=1 Tax=Thiomonas sp. TaxID=2047785 RepID=UPI002A3607A9|nr:HlyD family efflux transporter periplasmic adaptor subunit [Thiomonas sp.]MDY0329759.1 HlyD family efflux transporter periplasmic adaptor subunit [Thiomonas sp.]
MHLPRNRLALVALVLAAALAAAAFGWYTLNLAAPKQALAQGNGRIEAIEIDVAARQGGRLVQVLASEGATVRAGEVLARMDTKPLQAQLAEAQAQLERARNALQTAKAQLALRQSELAVAQAGVVQRESDLVAAEKRYARSKALVGMGGVAEQQLDDDRARVDGSRGALSAAQSQVAAARSAIAAARSQGVEAESAVRAAQAAVRRVQVEIDDCTIRAPIDGVVQYIISRPGEVLPPGGKILSLLDFGSLYMAFFLPEQDSGRVVIGDTARIVLDALPGKVIPATVSYVSSVAQFTPKTVETESERQKLMFRVKAQVDPGWAAARLPELKSGMPGVAYVRLDRNVPWPARLQVAPQ